MTMPAAQRWLGVSPTSNMQCIAFEATWVEWSNVSHRNYGCQIFVWRYWNLKCRKMEIKNWLGSLYIHHGLSPVLNILNFFINHANKRIKALGQRTVCEGPKLIVWTQSTITKKSSLKLKYYECFWQLESDIMWSSENCSEFQLKNLVQANVNVLVPFIYFRSRFMDLCQKIPMQNINKLH